MSEQTSLFSGPVNRGGGDGGRHLNDRYSTPTWCAEALLSILGVQGQRIIEPCAGNHHISDVLRDHGGLVTTCDLTPPDYPNRTTDHLLDLTRPSTYQHLLNTFDLCVTNPPFDILDTVLQPLLSFAPTTALFLRLNTLEPAKERLPLYSLLRQVVIVYPRPKFIRPDGSQMQGTDSITCAWFIFGSSPNPSTSFLTSYVTRDSLSNRSVQRSKLKL